MPDAPKSPLTANQARGFRASWGDWRVDGMDSFIYALVLAPALRELLPRFGIAATTGAIGYTIGAHFGWRAMFAIGGLPALLVGVIRFGIAEPARWRAHRHGTLAAPLNALFSLEYRSRTLLNSLYLFISIVGLWAGSVYVAGVGNASGGRGRIRTDRRGAPGFLGDHVALGGHDSRLPGSPSTRRTVRSPRPPCFSVPHLPRRIGAALARDRNARPAATRLNSL